MKKTLTPFVPVLVAGSLLVSCKKQDDGPALPSDQAQIDLQLELEREMLAIERDLLASERSQL